MSSNAGTPPQQSAFLPGLTPLGSPSISGAPSSQSLFNAQFADMFAGDLDFDTAYKLMSGDQPTLPPSVAPSVANAVTPKTPDYSGIGADTDNQRDAVTPTRLVAGAPFSQPALNPPTSAVDALGIQGAGSAGVRSPVSPGTRMLLNTFNVINYNKSSSEVQSGWNSEGASDRQKQQTPPYQQQQAYQQPPYQHSQQVDPQQEPSQQYPAQYQTHPAHPYHVPPTVSVAAAAASTAAAAGVVGPGQELLSSTETSALEMFLDSIANDEGLDNLAKQWSSIDPGVKRRPEQRRHAHHHHNHNRHNGQHNSRSQQQQHQHQQQQQQIRNSLPQQAVPSAQHPHRQPSFNGYSHTLVDQVGTQPQPQVPVTVVGSASFDFAPAISPVIPAEIPEPPRKRQRSQAKPTAPVLSEQEKKQNHMLSEQKRRAQIKEAFDHLVRLLNESQFEATAEHRKKTKSARKSMSKFNVLNRSVVEIEKLLELNKKLRAFTNEP